MDRIFEAYNGTGGFKPEFIRKTRERLHWTCSQVWGRKALDVGCSQGIGPILLGRMGIDVLGVDVNPEAIAFAKKELEKELDGVRRKVRFVCEDFAQFKNDEWAQVDAIVMGEVLEHLVRPADFIGRAFQLLKPAGRLVVTVPFGINDDPDHRQTFYLTSVYSFLFPYFEIAAVKFFGAWIGFVGKRRAAKTADPVAIPTRLFAQAEDAFNKLERPLVDMRTKAKDYARQIEEEQARSGDLSGQVSALQAKIAALETVSRRPDVVVIEDQVQELKTSLAVERQTNAGHQEQIALLKAALQLASQQKPDAANETRLLEYSQEVKDLRASLDSKSAELVERAERCGRLAAECESSKARVAELEAERDALRKSLEQETEQHNCENAAVRGRLTEVEAELAEKVRILAEVEAERVNLRRSFQDETEQHGREHTAVCERLAETEAELAAVRGRLAETEAGLAEKEKDLVEAARKLSAEEEARQEAQAGADDLGRRFASQVKSQAARIEELEETLAGERSWEEQHKRECVAVQDRLAAVEAELAAKAKALSEAETKSANEEKLHKKFSSDAYNLGKQVATQATRIKALESELVAKAKALTAIEEKCASEEKAHRKFSSEAYKLGQQVAAQMKQMKAQADELSKEKATFEQRIRALVQERDGLRASLKKSEAAYAKLSKAKLGRLTLRYWRWKDGFKSGRRVQSRAADACSAKQSLPQSDEAAWKAQRENEAKFFGKS